MARLRDISNVWSTIRELDVGDIRNEAEQPIRIALIGAHRFPARGTPPIDVYNLPLVRERTTNLGQADLVVLIIDGSQALSYDSLLAFEKTAVLQVPLVLVVTHANELPKADEGVPTPDWHNLEPVFLTDTENVATIRKTLGAAMVEALPETLRMAAGRRLPGLRGSVTNELLGSVALTNATYSLSTGLPEMIPILNLPLNAADMLVLTKNQALMVYRIALAQGAEGEFSAMIRELLPVIGGAFLWRQLARQLVGLLPGVGLLPKVAVSYAGTYVTGLIAERWFSQSELISRKEIQRLLAQALQEGRERATALLRQRNIFSDDASASPSKHGRLRRLINRIRARLSRNKALPPNEQSTDNT